MTYPRPSAFVLPLLALLLVSFVAMLSHATLSRYSDEVAAKRLHLVSALGLSDLTLFTEARYTRHPSMADLHTPFQDHPTSLEHFPTGSMISPPAHLNTLKSAIRSQNNGRPSHAVKY